MNKKAVIVFEQEKILKLIIPLGIAGKGQVKSLADQGLLQLKGIAAGVVEMEALVLFQKGKNDIGGDAGEKAIGQQDAQVVQIGGSQLVLNFVIGLDDAGARKFCCRRERAPLHTPFGQKGRYSVHPPDCGCSGSVPAWR